MQSSSLGSSMSSSEDSDVIVFLSSHYVQEAGDRLVTSEATTQVTVGRSRRETIIARTVAIVSLSLLTISVLLVMISLIMSHHIDQLVRDANKKFWYHPPNLLSPPQDNDTINGNDR